ncbi:hypothetical protein Tco_0821626 [Tanacetum coccineum]|uniref:Reverse transcriptase domain-containing protein n=1 Tax=Tanacetum coccineum TaxID=301880 RepID=A0ABQ5AFS2_9ASTR
MRISVSLRFKTFMNTNLCYNSNSSGFDQPTQTSIDHQTPKEISVRELLLQEKLHKALQAVCEKLNQQEQAANHSTHTPEPSQRFNFIYDDDNDDEESTIPLNEIISQIPPSIAITPFLPTMKPEDSLIMGDENLSIIPEKESDEFIKSSVEDLVPIPSECDCPFCDDSSPLDVLGSNSVTFSNPLFDSNYDFTSSNDELFPDEDEEIREKGSYVSNLDEQALLVTPLSDANEDECFDPGGDIDKIEACLTSDSIPPGINGADFDPEGDILLLEKLLNEDISFPPLRKNFILRDLK